MASSPHRGTTMPFSALPIPDLLAEASPAPDELLDSDVETVLDLDLSVDAAQATAAAPVLPEEPSSLPPPSAPPTLCLADPSIVFLDPHLLRFSADYNRDEASFDTPDFKAWPHMVAICNPSVLSSVSTSKGRPTTKSSLASSVCVRAAKSK